MILTGLLFILLSVGGESQRRKRQAVTENYQLWPDNTVFYRYKFPFTAAEQKNIQLAIQEWSAFTCVKFQQVPATSSKHAANIERTSKGCFVNEVGYRSKDHQPDHQHDHPLIINLGADCMEVKTVLHELGHTLGLVHEQGRFDRDRFVRINKANVKEEAVDQFTIPENQKSYGLPYSYRSVMHYGKDFFNKNRKPTIEALQKKYYDIIGNALHISFRDARIVNKMYSCSSHCRSPPTCAPNAFLGKNCRCWCRDSELTAVDCITKQAIQPSRVFDQKGRLIKSNSSGAKAITFWSEYEVDWYTARSKCRSMGGSLIAPKTPAAAKEVAKIMAQLKQQYNYEPPDKTFQDYLWTGGNDIDTEGSFKWLDGSVIDPVQLEFSRGEPNNGEGLNEDCVAIFPDTFPLFTDHDCGKTLRYICQFDSSCYDHSPTCPYCLSTGSCRNPVDLCQHTYKKCTPGAPANQLPNVEASTVNNPAENRGNDLDIDGSTRFYDTEDTVRWLKKALGFGGWFA